MQKSNIEFQSNQNQSQNGGEALMEVVLNRFAAQAIQTDNPKASTVQIKIPRRKMTRHKSRFSKSSADYIAWMLSTMRERGLEVVDVKKDPEEEYSAHCREADIATFPLRDCISYYNGHGEAEPGSLAYYGGRRWNTYRDAAQQTLEPYVFGTMSAAGALESSDRSSPR